MKGSVMKKIKTAVLTILLTILCFSVFIQTFGVKKFVYAEQGDSTEIEMYLIAGQSNAAGYSKYPIGQSHQTYENVWYAGMTDTTLIGSSVKSSKSNSLINFSAYKREITVGYGNLGDRIGPEYGMGQIFSTGASSEKPVFIFKTAAGGTSLLDTTAENSAYFGNWYPRSLWESGYEPNIDNCSLSNDATGLQYKLFVENFRTCYNTLKENGFNPIVKGMCWMQGETDLSLADAQRYIKYEQTLKVFINDIRNDLSVVTGDNTLKAMPFVIGEIAPSFIRYNNGNVPKLVEAQRNVANSVSNVETIKTDDLLINGQNGEVLGTDQFHFNFNDDVTLGRRFGEKLLEMAGKPKYVITANNTTVNCFEDGNNINIRVTPQNNYKLIKLIVNGIDCTNLISNGVCTIQKQIENVYNVEASIIEKTKYFFEYETDNGADFRLKPKSAYEGEKVELEIYPSKTAKIVKVLFNEQEVAFNTQTGKYEITPESNGKFSVLTEKVAGTNGGGSGSGSSQVGGAEIPTPNVGNNKPIENVSCSSNLSASYVLGALVVSCAFVLVKKLKNKTKTSL